MFASIINSSGTALELLINGLGKTCEASQPGGFLNYL